MSSPASHLSAGAGNFIGPLASGPCQPSSHAFESSSSSVPSPLGHFPRSLVNRVTSHYGSTFRSTMPSGATSLPPASDLLHASATQQFTSPTSNMPSISPHYPSFSAASATMAWGTRNQHMSAWSPNSFVPTVSQLASPRFLHNNGQYQRVPGMNHATPTTTSLTLSGHLSVSMVDTSQPDRSQPPQDILPRVPIPGHFVTPVDAARVYASPISYVPDTNPSYLPLWDSSNFSRDLLYQAGSGSLSTSDLSLSQAPMRDSPAPPSYSRDSLRPRHIRRSRAVSHVNSRNSISQQNLSQMPAPINTSSAPLPETRNTIDIANRIGEDYGWPRVENSVDHGSGAPIRVTGSYQEQAVGRYRHLVNVPGPLSPPVAPSGVSRASTAHLRGSSGNSRFSQSDSTDHNRTGAVRERASRRERHRQVNSRRNMITERTNRQRALSRSSEEPTVHAYQVLRGGLTKKAIACPSYAASLVKVNVDGLAEDDKTCLICYEPFGANPDDEFTEYPVKIPLCGHIFGHKCIGTWLKDSVNCPYCRSQLPKSWVFGSRNSALDQILARFNPVAADQAQEVELLSWLPRDMALKLMHPNAESLLETAEFMEIVPASQSYGEGFRDSPPPSSPSENEGSSGYYVPIVTTSGREGNNLSGVNQIHRQAILDIAGEQNL